MYVPSPGHLRAASQGIQYATNAYNTYQQYRSLKRGYDQISDMARRYSARKKQRRAAPGKGRGYGILNRKTMRSMGRKKAGNARAAKSFTTFQHDVKKTYKGKGRLTRRKRRSYKSNLYKELKLVQPRKYHYNGSRLVTTSQGQQTFTGIFTYGMDGTGGADGSGDLLDLTNRVVIDNQLTTAVEPNTFQNRRFYFETMNGRVQITNTGSQIGYVEVYTCLCRRDMATGVWGNSFDAMIANMTNIQFTGNPGLGNSTGAQTTTQTGTMSHPTHNTVGMTPFQFRPFCQYFKITDVTRLNIEAGKSVNFNFSDRRRRCFEHQEDAVGLLTNRRWTTCYLFRQWGQTITASGVTAIAASQMSFEYDKDYVVKLMEQSIPRLGYITYTNST